MNRKNQSQSGRQNMQTQPRGPRSQSQNRNGYDQASHEMNHNHASMNTGSHPRNFSGDSSWSNADANYDSQRNSFQSYRDTDYDLDGVTYGQQGRNPRSMERNFSGRMPGMEYGSSFNENDSNRSPLRYDRDENLYSSRFSPDRQASSSERFGYPTNMNAWSGPEHANYSGNSQNRMSHNSSFGSHDHDSSNHPQHSYGDAGSASFGSFGEDRSNRQDWGSQSTHKGFLGKGPKGYKRSDERIKEDVCETLSRDHRIDASDIEVNVDDAMVTLSGNVESREIKRAAEMIIENLSGVDDVKNEIKVKKTGEMNNDSLHASGLNKNSNTNTSSKSSTTKSTGHI